MKTHTAWLPEHIEFLKNNYKDMSRQEMADKLGKTKKSITHKLGELGLKKDRGVHKGDKFGKLEVINEPSLKPVGKSQALYADCKCDCGNIEIIRVQTLKEQRIQCIECGRKKYQRSPDQRLNPTGNEEMRNGTRYAEYICLCGEVKWIVKQQYLDNKTKSCGCLNQEKRKARVGDKNGRFKHGLVGHPLHLIFHTIKSRCTNPNFEQYHGGNIRIEQSWLDDFVVFYNWAIKNGWKEGLCISRKDYIKDYSPENCYITTAEEISNKEEVKTKVYEASKSAILEKYGVEHPRDIPGVDEKIKKTNLERYGHESPMGNKEIQQKAINTNIKNYGQEKVPFEIYKDKLIATNQKRHGVDYAPQNKEITQKGVETRIKRGLIYVHDGLKAAEWSEKVGIAASTMRKRIKDLGFEEAIKIPKRQSTIEYKMEKFLNESNIVFESYKKIEDKYADFVLKENNLIIEVDGLYWHSDAINSDKKYHVKKKELYKRNGYDTLFFREDEMENKFEIVQSIVLNKLGSNSVKIFARKTKIVEVSKKDAVAFFRNNHLMGKGSGKTYGLEYEGKIVSAIRINRRGRSIEISRFCNLLNTSVIGGYSKLISHIEKAEKPELIKTFVDLRYGDGTYLSELGFEKIRESVSFRWVRDDKTVSRQQYTGNTGYENRCFKIWDCGQALWQKKIPQEAG